MKLDYVSLLRVMRDLHAIPPGQPPDFNGKKRFKQYLRTIFEYDRKVCKLPLLLAMNPIGKDHVTALLDAYLAMDGDGIGARATAEAAARLADVPGDFKVGLVVCDDLMGGGTNRYFYEFGFRFGRAIDGTRLQKAPSQWIKDFWLQGVLWSSEAPTELAVWEAILMAAHRVAYTRQFGPSRTLREMLAQERQVMALAGCSGPTLDAEDIAYTRDVLMPHLDAEDMRTCMECLFGDAAARSLGFTPQGLSTWAGLALALHDARPNQADAPNAGMTPRFHSEHHRRGVGDLRRSAWLALTFTHVSGNKRWSQFGNEGVAWRRGSAWSVWDCCRYRPCRHKNPSCGPPSRGIPMRSSPWHSARIASPWHRPATTGR